MGGNRQNLISKCVNLKQYKVYIVDDENVIVIRILKDRMYWQPVIERMKKINL